MKNCLKKLLSIGIIATGMLMLNSCAKDESEAKVYYLNFKPEVADVWQEIAKIYEEETGVEVKVITAASGTYEQVLQSEMAKREAPTLFQINGPNALEIWGQFCEELGDTKIYEWLLDKNLAVSDDTGVYGIPYVVEDMMLQKDKLGIEGVFTSTSFAAGEDWRWQTHLLNMPVYYEFSDKNITDTDNLEMTYGDNFKNIFDLYINNSCTAKTELNKKTVNDSMTEFAHGKVAMVQNGNWGWSQIKSVSGNTVDEK